MAALSNYLLTGKILFFSISARAGAITCGGETFMFLAEEWQSTEQPSARMSVEFTERDGVAYNVRIATPAPSLLSSE